MLLRVWRASHQAHNTKHQHYLRLSVRSFHASRPLRASPSTHYDTLGLSPTATQVEVKKQFYTLSKSHHPDLHPNDPSASEKFVQISSAYAVLGSPDKRAAYDRTLGPAAAGPPRGSHSSHSASSPAGARPASGLSTRRTRFRGPPPSFYARGGWGAQAGKRAEHAARPEAAGQAQAGQAYTGGEPGMGPGGFSSGQDYDVPHFDREGHTRTHENVEGRRRTRGFVSRDEIAEARAAGGPIAGFLMITGVLGIALGVGGMINGKTREADRRR